MEFVTERDDPLEFEEFVHLCVAQAFDGFFALQVKNGGFLFDRGFQRFLFGEAVSCFDDLGLVGIGIEAVGFFRLGEQGLRLLSDSGVDEFIARLIDDFLRDGGVLFVLAEAFEGFLDGCDDFAEAGFFFADRRGFGRRGSGQ